MVRTICDRYNVLLIYDEVITGFGRLGEPFAADYFQVRPDILCCGKGMSGGLCTVGGGLVHRGNSPSLCRQGGRPT